MSSFTDFFNPTPTQPPNPFQPPGYDLLRQLLMQKIFGLEANPYGLSGQTAANPQSFLGNTLNMNTPFFQGSFGGQTSGGAPGGGVNPAWSQPGGARTPIDVTPRPTAPLGGARMDGHRVPIVQRHFDGLTNSWGPGKETYGQIQNQFNSQFGAGPYSGLAQSNPGTYSNFQQMMDMMSRGRPWLMQHFGNLVGQNPTMGAIPGTGSSPGFQYTGAQHEMGGNQWAPMAALSAGWSPTQFGQWLLNGVNAQLGQRTSAQGQANLAAGKDVWGNAMPTPLAHPTYHTQGHGVAAGVATAPAEQPTPSTPAPRSAPVPPQQPNPTPLAPRS